MEKSLWERVRCALRDRHTEQFGALDAELKEAKELSGEVRGALRAQLFALRDGSAKGVGFLKNLQKKRPLGPHESLIMGCLTFEANPDAERLFQTAARAKVRDPRVPEGFGMLALSKGDPKRAIELLEQALKLDPEAWSAHFALGNALSQTRAPEQARGHFQEAVKRRPDHEPSWLGYAAQSIMAGKAAEAAEVLSKLVAEIEERPRLLQAYADCLHYSGEVGRGLEVLLPLAQKSDDPEFHLDLAKRCMIIRDPVQGRPLIERAQKLAPKNPEVFYIKGKLQELLGVENAKGAIASHRTALALDPGHLLSKESLARLLMEDTPERNLDEARALLESLSGDKNALAQRSKALLGHLLSLQGEHEQAQQLAREVLQAEPDSEDTIALAKRLLEPSS